MPSSPPAPRPISPTWSFRPWKQAFREAGLPKLRAKQVFRWIYRKGVTDFELMSDLADRAADATGSAVRHLHASAGSRGALDRRHAQVPVSARRRQAHRVGLHPRHAEADVLHLQPGRLRHGLRLLPHRQDGVRAQPHRRPRSPVRCAYWPRRPACATSRSTS